MRKILCATDETEVSRKAEVFAVQLAKDLGLELTYVYVSPVTPDDLPNSGPGRMAADPTVLEEVEAREHAVLRHAEQVARENGYQAQCLIIRNHDIAAGIVNFAEKEGFDHIVTGSTGRIGIPRFLLGSIASKIIHKAHCPVTVVR